ncbi:thiol-disulfide oxidoreductase DCC family protein [Thermoactinomyces sp. CICC 10522]|uniref:thiol-disulfide oxidoreductase DCC family protein n=1 Tax=Thermoactinomyces sp. CICC 10522 TaxID=2767427 RepID=UPI0018DEBFB1|nr:thiol-disulfide oxidoreductase DCC family protein [Thermoactinomyces sp. CICC 10522]MBH8604995.1 thiol-disulfide oxidoreductase DCC family protein [Thermoactinomyces sp. CICC 10522]
MNGRNFPFAVIFFDGVCNFCNHWVQFLLKKDKAGVFRFASLQSKVACSVLPGYGIEPGALESIVLLENGRCYTESAAVLRICRRLKGGWRWFSLLGAIPRPFRDYLYRQVAKRRYRWFGRTESCMVPDKEMRDRFLEDF